MKNGIEGAIPMKMFCAIALALAALALPVDASTVKFAVITEADPGVPTGNQFLREYDDLANLKTLNQSTITQLGPNAHGTGVSFAALSYDGNKYYTITESDPGVPTGNQFLREYDSLADLRALNQSSVAQLGPHAFGTGVSFRGLAYNGSQYLVITESDPGVPTGNQFLRFYDTLADLKALNQSSIVQLGSHAFGTGVSFAGLTFDGTKYHVITESDPGVPTGNQFLRTYDTLADLMALNQSSITQLGPHAFGTGVSFGGLMAMPQKPPIGAIPLPTTLPLTSGALLILGGLGHYRRRQVP